MKRATIVHCWEGYPEYCWYPWLKNELEKRDFRVSVPAFPDTDNPKQDQWVDFLKKEAGSPDKNLYLVGHSIGSAAIMRYLEDLKEWERVGGVLFVAGFTENPGYKEVQSFFGKPFDFGKIKQGALHFAAIFSDNDPHVDLKFADIFKEKLGAESQILHNMGHFSGSIENEAACLELPGAAGAILKMSGENS